MIQRIKLALPDAAIILTTPSDHFLFRKKPNEKISGLCRQIYTLAQNEGCAIWNLYEIMGGKSSIKTWQLNKLAGSDKIHFTQAGYVVQGKLFFDALSKAFQIPQSIVSETPKL